MSAGQGYIKKLMVSGNNNNNGWRDE